VRILVAALLALAVLGCNSSSNSTSCRNQTCTINLTGAPQDVELEDFPQRGRDTMLYVDAIEGDQVTVRSFGSEATLGPGASATVDRVQVSVTSIEGNNVTLEVAPAS
jgi:hypothetical protein